LGHLVARGLHASRELPRLLRAIGIDPAVIGHKHPDLLRTMSLTCSTCCAKQVCQGDLKAGTARQRFGRYCLNAREINILDAELWKSREKAIQSAIGVAARMSRVGPDCDRTIHPATARSTHSG
jgi:hypothetical protein